MNTQENNQDTALAQQTNDMAVRAPAVDIYETNDRLLFVADLPGVTDEDIDVRLDKGELTFAAQRKPQVAGDGHAPFMFRRAFVLPKGILPDDIAAKFEHGVLRIEIPKSDVTKTRQIAVTAG